MVKNLLKRHKPYGEADIRRMITQIRPKDYELTPYILLPDGQKIILRDIIYTEYDNQIISIHRKRSPLAQTRLAQAAFEQMVADDAYMISCSKGLMVNLHYCQHHTLNMLPAYFSQLPKENGIACSIKANIPAQLPIPDNDLAVLIGNLVENALEACIARPPLSGFPMTKASAVKPTG